MCTVLLVDTAMHLFGLEGNSVIEYSHANNDDYSSVPELVEENVVQEYILPEELNGEYSIQIRPKAIHVGLVESLYEHNTPVPPPDLS